MEKTTLIIIAVVVCLPSISIGVGIYFATKSSDTKSSTASAPASAASAPATASAPAPTPANNWAGNKFSTDGRCGPNFGNTACGGNSCCSTFGWCGGSKGQKDDWCHKFHGYEGKFDGQKP